MPAVAVAAPVNKSVKLPVFWPANIAAWFASMECIFELCGIVKQRARYFNVLAALPEATVVLIESSPLPEDPFGRLKARLVTAPQHTSLRICRRLRSCCQFPSWASRNRCWRRCCGSAPGVRRTRFSLTAYFYGSCLESCVCCCPKPTRLTSGY
jgi:hypothetical protein